MKLLSNNCFIILLCLTYSLASAESKSDSTKVNIGISTYTFLYDAGVLRGSFATGPSVLVTGENVSLQLSVLFDFKRYVAYGKYSLGYSIRGGYTPDRVTNIFVPLLLHYNYYGIGNNNYFVTAGTFFSRNYYLENSRAIQTEKFSFLAGTGMSYNFNKRHMIRGLVSLQYAQVSYGRSIFIPGLILEILL